MVCLSPPELPDKDLLAYLDGDAGQSVVAHVERCAHCRERARQLAHFQSRLTANLYRLACPSTAELGEYHLDLLPEQQKASLAQHVTDCPHCSREIAELEIYMEQLAPDVAFSSVERIKARIAQLVGAATGPCDIGRPALAGIRGEDAGPYIYEAGPVQITLEIQEQSERADHVILGLIAGVEPDPLQIHVWRDEERIARVPVDELGNFVIPGLSPGTYQLIITGLEEEIHVQSLEV
jgi:hypothetical protein